MQVSAQASTNYSLLNQNRPIQNHDLTQDQIRAGVTQKLGQESKQAQLDAYVAGTEQANGNDDNYTQNYNDFATSVRRSDNYSDLVASGAELPKISDRPSTLPVQGQDLDQDQKDSLRELGTQRLGQESKEAQLDAYKAGTQQANGNTDDYVTNYNEFATDVRRSDNYSDLVASGAELSNTPFSPSPLPTQSLNELDSDQQESLGGFATQRVGQESKEAQLDAYKAGTENSNSEFDETLQYVENFNELAADARKSGSINTYIEQNNYLAG